MKIAAITEDGKTISKHFGRAPNYLVATVEEGEIVHSEMRDKLGHAQLHHESHEGHHSQPHGTGKGAHSKHMRMSEPIIDCEALLCGGMGGGAYQSMLARGIKPVVTEIDSIEEAVMAYVNGTIIDRVERLH